MSTLYASIIRLRALHPGQLGRDAGQWANAAFYAILRHADPGLADGLHQWNGRKPFTVSTLEGLPPGKGAFVELPAGWECWLRVTTLGEGIFLPFIQTFLQGISPGSNSLPTVRLGPLQFGVTEVLTTPAAHPWAGFCDPEELLAPTGPVDRLALEFASPTAFNLGTLPGSSAYFALFPNPPLVFRSLADKWQAFVSPLLDLAYVEDLSAEVRVSDYRLRTQTLQWKGHIQKGFTGRCTFDLRGLSSDDQHLLSALADFAFFAGIGGKTTQGMGQARRVAV